MPMSEHERKAMNDAWNGVGQWQSAKEAVWMAARAYKEPELCRADDNITGVMKACIRPKGHDGEHRRDYRSTDRCGAYVVWSDK